MIRDIYFNEEKLFNNDNEILKYDIKNILLKYLTKVINKNICKGMLIVLFNIIYNIIKDLEWPF